VADFPPPDLLYPDIPGLIARLGLGKDIVQVPYVQEADKPALYRAALMLGFPSMYEGFGLTPLEAMASGVPVVASNATSIPEVVGGGGLLLPPNDPETWASSLLRLVDSPEERGALAAAGVERAKAFSWRRTAEATAAVYREVLGA
jgi:glycosyltransferase involved in cell wall biosynthesis